MAWPLLGNLTCQEMDENCTKGENPGWRYFLIVMVKPLEMPFRIRLLLTTIKGSTALIMFFLRFACFTIYESPKFLMGKGDDAGAVAIVHEVARRNGKTPTLTLDDLQACNVLTFNC